MRWYNDGAEEIHKLIFEQVKKLQTRQAWRNELNQRHYRLYGNMLSYGFFDPIMQIKQDRITFNIVLSAISTLVSKISKNRPKPFFLTEKGNWSAQQMAKKLNKFSLGMFNQTKAYDKALESLLHALVFGDGFMKIYADKGEIKCEPRLPIDLLVDDREALYGNPMQFFETRVVDRDTLIEMYPEYEKKIKLASKERSPYMSPQYYDTDLILVIEAWKKGIRNEAGEIVGGKHALVLDNCTLIGPEEYNKDRFPFARLKYEPNLTGYWSKGACEVLTPHQVEINRTLKRIQQSFHLLSSPKVLYDYNSKIVKTHFNNDVGAMIGYMGTPPQFINPSAVNPELMQWLQYLVQQSFAEVGISMLSSSAQKPAGLNSGKALREFNDIETERFAKFVKHWERFHLDINEHMIDCAKEIEEKDGKYEVVAPDGKFAEKIKFSEIDIEKDSYVLQAYPTNLLSSTPAGKLDDVMDMIQIGLLSPEEAMMLLDYPDTEKLSAFKGAGTEDIRATADQMIETGEYLPPEQYQDLQFGIKYMQSSYLYYKQGGVPQKRLELLLQWINDAMDIANPPSMQQMPPPIPGQLPQGQPPAQGQPIPGTTQTPPGVQQSTPIPA